MTYTRKRFLRSVGKASVFMGLVNPLSLLGKTSLYSNVVINDPLKNDPVNDGSLSDTNLQYIGRWDKTDSLQFHSYWGGAYIKTMFTGGSIDIKLALDTMLVVSIDNEVPRSVNGKQGITSLLEVSLKDGLHSLLVGSAGQNYEVHFQGFVLSVDGKTMAPKKLPLIEFIGDSITTGTGPDKISTVNYAWNTATALGCDHTQIAFSGISLTSEFGCLPDKTGMDKQYFRLKNFNHLKDNPQKDWDFTYTPDLIVINLGQNDQCGSEPARTFTESMTGFLGNLRARYPKTQIAVLRPFGGPYAASIIEAVSTLNKKDKNVHYIDTTGWLDKEDYSDGIHPNGTGGQKLTGYLVPLLRPLLKG